jgi:hypothetical protein
VAANADTALGMQSLLPLTFAARIFKQMHLAAGRRVPEDHVGNQLLETRILFHLRSRSIADVLAGKEGFQVSIDVGAEPLKVPELMKSIGRHDEYLFHGDS